MKRFRFWLLLGAAGSVWKRSNLSTDFRPPHAAHPDLDPTSPKNELFCDCFFLSDFYESETGPPPSPPYRPSLGLGVSGSRPSK